jgi:hypothetical protein
MTGGLIVRLDPLTQDGAAPSAAFARTACDLLLVGTPASFGTVSLR